MRVATNMLDRTLTGAMQQTQQAILTSQSQLATGKKVQTLADLGTDGVADLSAHAMLGREQSYIAAGSTLGTTLKLYDAQISSIDTLGSTLQKSILTAVGTDDPAGLQDAIDTAFQQFRSALNARQGDVPLFGGSQTGDPFTPQTLADAASATPATAFTNDDVHASTRLGDGIDLSYGVTASEVGSDMLGVFKTLASIGTISGKPTAAQTAALNQAASQLDGALTSVRAVNARNGRNQAQVDTLTTRAQDRSTLLQDVISTKEDADMGQVATDLSRQQSLLQISYSVFSRISSLNLTSYLR
ncbi:MAG: flagellin [Sphingomonas sp.]